MLKRLGPVTLLSACLWVAPHVALADSDVRPPLPPKPGYWDLPQARSDLRTPVELKKARRGWKTARTLFTRQKYSEAGEAYLKAADDLRPARRQKGPVGVLRTARCMALENSVQAYAMVESQKELRKRVQKLIRGQRDCKNSLRHALDRWTR